MIVRKNNKFISIFSKLLVAMFLLYCANSSVPSDSAQASVSISDTSTELVQGNGGAADAQQDNPNIANENTTADTVEHENTDEAKEVAEASSGADTHGIREVSKEEVEAIREENEHYKKEIEKIQEDAKAKLSEIDEGDDSDDVEESDTTSETHEAQDDISVDPEKEEYQNTQRFKEFNEKIENFVNSVDDRLTGFDETRNDYSDVLNRHDANKVKEVAFPDMNVNGMIINVDSYTPKTFDEAFHTARNVSKSEPPSEDDIITFQQDYTAQLRKMRQDEYKQAKFFMDREYRHLRAIEAKMRVLSDKKDRLSSNIEMLKQKYVLDKKNLLNKTQIVNKKIAELKKTKEQNERIEAYKSEVVSTIENLHESIKRNKTVSGAYLKYLINKDSIDVMRNDYNDVKNYSDHFNDEVYAMSDIFKKNESEIYNILNSFSEDDQTKKHYLNVEGDVEELHASVLELSKTLDTGSKKNQAPEDIASSVINSLSNWKKKFFDTFRLTTRDMVEATKIEKAKYVRRSVAECAKTLANIYDSHKKFFETEYSAVDSRVEELFNGWDWEIKNVESRTESNGSLSTEIVNKNEDESANCIERLRSLEQEIYSETNMHEMFYVRIHTLDESLEKLSLLFQDYLDAEKEKMQYQKERFLKKMKRSKYKVVLNMEINFWKKYQNFINQRKQVTDKLLGKKQISNESYRTDAGDYYSVIEETMQQIEIEFSDNFDKLLIDFERDAIKFHLDSKRANEYLGKMLAKMISELESVLTKVKSLLNRSEEIAHVAASGKVARLVKETFNNEIISIKHEDEQLSVYLGKSMDSLDKIESAFRKSVEYLTSKINEADALANARQEIFDKHNTKIEEDIKALKNMKVPLIDLASTFEDYANYKSELEHEYKRLSKEYSDLEEAEVEDIHNMKLESVSLKADKELAVKRIKSLQHFVNKMIPIILKVVPSEESGVDPNASNYVSGYEDAQDFVIST